MLLIYVSHRQGGNRVFLTNLANVLEHQIRLGLTSLSRYTFGPHLEALRSIVSIY